MKVDKKATGGAQLTLDRMLEKQSKVKIYMCDGATHAVAQFVVCDDQVCMMAVWHVDAQIGWPGSCSCWKTNFLQLFGGNEAQDDLKRLT